MNKPLFNRPILYTSLLSELVEGKNDTHAVYSTTVADEYTLRTPDALMSGTATESVIKSCCPDILEPKNLKICDIQHLLATTKIATQGPSLEVLLPCPICKSNDPYDIDLQQNISFLSARKWYEPLTIDKMIIILKPPSYREFSEFSIEEFKLNKQLYQISKMEDGTDYADITASILDQQQILTLKFQAHCIEKIQIPDATQFDELFYYNVVTKPEYIFEWLVQCDIDTHKRITGHLQAAFKEASFPDIHVSCTECNAPLTIPIDLDFCRLFRQRLISASESDILDIIKTMSEETKTLTNDLLKMIWFMRGSISYSEAYSLTTYERQCISKIIEENLDITKKTGMPFV